MMVIIKKRLDKIRYFYSATTIHTVDNNTITTQTYNLVACM